MEEASGFGFQDIKPAGVLRCPVMPKDRYQPLIPEPPEPRMKACVVVPARNEEELLPSALHALAEQKRLDGRPLDHATYEVLVLVNNSTDRSVDVAKSFQRLYKGLRLYVIERNFDDAHSHIGHVRRSLMDEACARLETVAVHGGCILSTDADTRVAPNWICRNLEELDKGVDAVGGRIVVPPCEQDACLDLRTQTLYRYDELYARLVCWVEDCWDSEAHDPWPRHHHHFGGSLALTPNAYKGVGRLPPRRFLEDVALYDAFRRHDLRIRHANTVRVFSSARVQGRIRWGLSRRLRDWQQLALSANRVRVESARFLEHLFQTRARLRKVWSASRAGLEPRSDATHAVCSALSLPVRYALEIARTSRCFGLLLERLDFYERCRAQWPDWVRLARLTDTVEQLRAAFEVQMRARSKVRQPVFK